MSLAETSQNTTKPSENTNADDQSVASRLKQQKRTIIIGVAGGTGSGKTTVARKIREAFPPHCVQVIAQDSYYKDQSHMSKEKRRETNYDHPDAYDNELLISHLDALRRGESIQMPVYSFIEHTRSKETILVEPAHIIIVEGILVLHNESLRDRMDVKIFVQTDADLRFIRRLKRDMKERGRSINDVIAQYKNVVRPMHMLYTEPSKTHADIIIPEGGANTVAIEMVRGWLGRVLDEIRSNTSPGVHYMG